MRHTAGAATKHGCYKISNYASAELKCSVSQLKSQESARSFLHTRFVPPYKLEESTLPRAPKPIHTHLSPKLIHLFSRPNTASYSCPSFILTAVLSPSRSDQIQQHTDQREEAYERAPPSHPSKKGVGTFSPARPSDPDATLCTALPNILPPHPGKGALLLEFSGGAQQTCRNALLLQASPP